MRPSRPRCFGLMKSLSVLSFFSMECSLDDRWNPEEEGKTIGF